MEILIKFCRIRLGCNKIKIQAWNASKSAAIDKLRPDHVFTYIRVGDAEINCLVPRVVGHDLISGSLNIKGREFSPFTQESASVF